MKRRAAATPVADPYEAAVRYLAPRPRSVGEIRRHLRSKRVDAAAIDRVIDQLRAQRYVDDEAFARYWIEQRDRFRPKGQRAVVSELIEKGVPRDVIDLVVGEREPDSEVKRARESIRPPMARWLTLAEPERKRKIQQYLAQRGFGYDTIEEVLARPAVLDD